MKVTDQDKLIEVQYCRYPVYLVDVRKKFPTTTIQDGIDHEKLRSFGFELVRQLDPPEDKVVYEEVTPLRNTVTGFYEQCYVVYEAGSAPYEKKLQQRKDGLSSQLMSIRARQQEMGKPYTFPNGQVLHIQLRDGDRANILGLLQMSNEYIAAGMADQKVFSFRSYENKNVPLNPLEMKALSMWAFGAFMSILQASWDIQNRIIQAATFEELPVLPETL